MKFNGTIFSKPQQDQLKEKIGNELEKVSAKVDEVDARMLNYKGDWVEGYEYHENDIVTWTDNGNLYEVIKSHTSSTSIKPNNTEYYKAMTTKGYYYKIYGNNVGERTSAVSDITYALNSNRRAFCYITQINGYKIRLDFSEIVTSYNGVVATGIHRDAENDYYPAIILLYLSKDVLEISKIILQNTGITRLNLTPGSTIRIEYEV